MFTLFYDIQQAYDSVQLTALIRSLTRIRLPASFIALIADSLTGLFSAILTSYGLTQSFPVKRSVRQGDSLAPLLFIILMDALHDGLDTNPFTFKQHGCTLTFPHNNIYLPSLGYADDSTVICNTLEDLKVQNEWVAFFMEFNHLRLNPKKCDLVGRMADGSSVLKQSIQDANIKIDGHVPTPLSHDYAIRYLGAHFSFDGSWKEQQNLTRNMICKRSAHFIVKSLHGEAPLSEEDNLRSPTDSGRTHVFDTTPYEGIPNPDQCSNRNTTQQANLVSTSH